MTFKDNTLFLNNGCRIYVEDINEFRITHRRKYSMKYIRCIKIIRLFVN